MNFLCRAPEIDISELESLFSAASDGSGANKAGGRRSSNINKPEKVQLVKFSLIFSEAGALSLVTFKIAHNF